MSRLDKPLRLAVLGPGRSGQVHIRILHSLGAQVCAVLCSSRQSAERAAQAAAATCHHVVKPHWSLERLLDEDLDALTICTPAHCHLPQILAAFDWGLPVFCEKPMFWDDTCTPSVVTDRLQKLEEHESRRLFVNTSNTVFIDTVDGMLPAAETAGSFTFRFHTTGPLQQTDIALDLLPHGLSFLLRIFGERTVSEFCWQPSQHSCPCRFQYGSCQVDFDFQENPRGSKLLSFDLDGRGFDRVQEGTGASFRVYLRDEQSGQKLRAPDPFVVYLSRFLEFCCRQPLDHDDLFHVAAANMRLMAQCAEQGRASLV